LKPYPLAGAAFQVSMVSSRPPPVARDESGTVPYFRCNRFSPQVRSVRPSGTCRPSRPRSCAHRMVVVRPTLTAILLGKLSCCSPSDPPQVPRPADRNSVASPRVANSPAVRGKIFVHFTQLPVDQQGYTSRRAGRDRSGMGPGPDLERNGRARKSEVRVDAQNS